MISDKSIIFLATQGYLLFAITQGLLSLMFPFCWMHTYIPILSNAQMDVLDSPSPYVIGVISNKTDFSILNDKYPGHVICDLNSSIINANLKNLKVANSNSPFNSTNITNTRYSNRLTELDEAGWIY